MNNGLTYEYVSNYINQKSNGECCLIYGDIKDSNSPITLKCKCGNIFESSYKKVRERDKIRCNECVNNERRKKYSMTFEKVLEIIKSFDCEYVSGDYINNSSKLIIRCKCGNVFERDIQHLQRGQYLCTKCSREKLSNSKCKYTKDIAIELFNKWGIILEDETQYKNASSLVDCICKDGHHFKTKLQWHLNKTNPFVCEECAIKYHSGENHWNYKGGESEVMDYFRKSLKGWKQQILKRYNYKCYLTNSKKDLVVHHITSFMNIIYDSCKELNLPLYRKINDYSKQDFELLSKKVLEKHQLDTGIVLQRKVHSKFHTLYGKPNNTLEQFNEFIKKYYPQKDLIPTLNVVEKI